MLGKDIKNKILNIKKILDNIFCSSYEKTEKLIVSPKRLSGLFYKEIFFRYECMWGTKISYFIFHYRLGTKVILCRL